MRFDRQLLYLALVFTLDRVSCLAIDRSGCECLANPATWRRARLTSTSAAAKPDPSISPNLSVTPSRTHEATAAQASNLEPILALDSSLASSDGMPLPSTFSKLAVGDSAADLSLAPKSTILPGQSRLHSNLGYSTPSSAYPTTILATDPSSSPKNDLRKRAPASMASRQRSLDPVFCITERHCRSSENRFQFFHRDVLYNSERKCTTLGQRFGICTSFRVFRASFAVHHGRH